MNKKLDAREMCKYKHEANREMQLYRVQRTICGTM